MRARRASLNMSVIHCNFRISVTFFQEKVIWKDQGNLSIFRTTSCAIGHFVNRKNFTVFYKHGLFVIFTYVCDFDSSYKFHVVAGNGVFAGGIVNVGPYCHVALRVDHI